MPADTFLWLVAQALFLGVFAFVGIDFVRRPQSAKADIALFFGIIAAILVVTDVPGSVAGAWLIPFVYALLGILPFVMLRLVDDFAPQPRVLLIGAGVVVAGLALSPFLLTRPWPVWFSALPEVWFFGLGGYASLAFAREARRTRGVTSRRMEAVAIGSSLIGLVLVGSLVQLVVPASAPILEVFIRLAALAAGVAYVLGFAPPSILRRAWQEPELRSFLERAAELPRLPDTPSIVRALEQGAADSTGASWAVIGLWDADRHRLRYRRKDGTAFESADDELIGGICFTQGRPLFTADAARLDPAHAEVYTSTGATTVLAAPIRAGDKRLGVLTVYAARAPIFAEDDLSLVHLLADQAAVVLESRSLIDDAARVTAREQATRLKDDFLSAAAHDLRTPLTTLLLHADLLKRETLPDVPARPARVDGIVSEARRLRELVTELLDGMQTERGHLTVHREPTELVSLAAELCAARSGASHQCRLVTDGAVTADVDPFRISQLLTNLLDNAVKYSPEGGDVVVEIRRDGEAAVLTVTDCGIGIPAADLPHLFDRFHRGSNVDDRRFHGLGLGLYICRGIVEQHGGQISATSELDAGTRFEVRLPLHATASAGDTQPATSVEGPAETDPQAILMPGAASIELDEPANA